MKTLLKRIKNRLFGISTQVILYKNFFKKIPKQEKYNAGNILIYAGIGHTYLTTIEILIYHLLTYKGYKVEYFIYDEEVEINELITADVVQKQGKDRFWNKSVSHAKKILGAAGVRYSYISKLSEVNEILAQVDFSKLEHILSFKHDGIDFGNIVEGVMYKYYKSKNFEEDALIVAHKFLTTALTNYYQIRHLATTKKYEYILFSHGIYCTWGPVAQFCRNTNLNFITYDRAKTKGHCNFNLNQPSPVWDFNTSWIRMKDRKLNDAEISRVNDYLEERILQQNDVYVYNFSNKEKDISALKQRLGIASNARVITFFTNLIWDAANVSRDIAFSSPLDCIIQTIKNFAHRSDVHILIKTHPAEKVLGTNEGYSTIIKNGLNNVLPPNVTIIEPEDSINSFSVIDITTIGVTHTSTVGLELAINGKPSILISETHYRGKGFTYDVNSGSEYFDLLENLLLSPSLKERQVENSKKYFYVMMFEYQHKMPMSFDELGLFKRYSYPTFKHLIEDKEAPICHIVDRIAAGDIFTDFIFS